MSITQNASRVRVESAAKNGTLSTQGALNNNQIKFDTNISTNNSNLEASPSFRRRHVILRPGEVDEEFNQVQSVDVDGVTCTCYEDWDSNPASGDLYEIAYRLEDVVTIAGCDFETDSQQWVMTKRLILGVGTTADGFLGMSHGQILRLNDEGPSTTAFRLNSRGVFCIGTIKNDRGERGAVLTFDNNADDETVMDFSSGAQGRLYEFTLIAARGHSGVTGLTVTVDAGADVEWARAQLHGMNAPFKKRVKRVEDIDGNVVLTKSEVTDLPELKGWCISSLGKSVNDALTAEAAGDTFHLLIEDG